MDRNIGVKRPAYHNVANSEDHAKVRTTRAGGNSRFAGTPQDLASNLVEQLLEQADQGDTSLVREGGKTVRASRPSV
jgi:hypothetical protein